MGPDGMLFIFSLLDEALLLFLAVYFVSFSSPLRGRGVFICISACSNFQAASLVSEPSTGGFELGFLFLAGNY